LATRLVPPSDVGKPVAAVFARQRSAQGNPALDTGPAMWGEEQNMIRSSYFYLAIVIVAIGTAAAYILPLS